MATIFSHVAQDEAGAQGLDLIVSRVEAAVDIFDVAVTRRTANWTKDIYDSYTDIFVASLPDFYCSTHVSPKKRRCEIERL